MFKLSKSAQITGDNFRVVGRWLDGESFSTCVYRSLREANAALKAFRDVGLLDATSLEIVSAAEEDEDKLMLS